MATTAKGIYSPDGTSGFDPVADMGTMATSIDSIVDANVADLAALAALTGMSSGNASKVREGQAIYLYNGTTWVQITPATFATATARDTAYAKASGAYRVFTAVSRVTTELWNRRWSTEGSGSWKPDGTTGAMLPIRPTLAAGSGATIGPEGVVTYSASSNAVLTAFSADFENYVIKADFYSTAANASIISQVAVGTALDTATNYFYAGPTSSSGSASVGALQSGSATSWDIARCGSALGTMGKLTFNIYSPAVSTKQTGYDSTSSANNGSAAVYIANGGFYNGSKTHDGIAFLASGGGTSLTGTVRIYGVVNN